MSIYQASSVGAPSVYVQPSPPERIAAIGDILAKKLGPEYLSTRTGGGGSKLTYVEGWRVLELTNKIFGWDGWFSEIKTLHMNFCDIAPSKAASDSVRYNIGVTAIVRVWTKDGGSHEDVGFGQIENAKSKADGLDKCQKEAVTDAIKRSLRMFGNVLGNCIYDKSFISNVSKVKPVKEKFSFDSMLRPEFAAATKTTNVDSIPISDPVALVTTSNVPLPTIKIASIKISSDSKQHHLPVSGRSAGIPPAQNHACSIAAPLPTCSIAVADLEKCEGKDDDSLYDCDLDMEAFEMEAAFPHHEGSGEGDSGFCEPRNENLCEQTEDGSLPTAPSTRFDGNDQSRAGHPILSRHALSKAAPARSTTAPGLDDRRKLSEARRAEWIAGREQALLSNPSIAPVQPLLRSHPPLQPPQAPSRSRTVATSGTYQSLITVAQPPIPAARNGSTYLPSLSVGSSAGRMGGGTSTALREILVEDDTGTPGLMSARGVKRYAERNNQPSDDTVPNERESAQPRQPLGDLSIDPSGQYKRSRLS